MATVKISELPATQVVGQIEPTVAADAVAGQAAEFRASDAVAGNANAGAAAGGAATVRGGDAARLTSGNADGGNVVLTGGAGIGTGVNGQVSVTRDGTAGRPAITFGSDPDTGIYRVGANSLGFAVSGFTPFSIDASTITCSIAVNGSGNAFGNNRLYPFTRTTNANLSSNQLDGGPNSIVTHTGASGEVIFTLPTSSLQVGINWVFAVTAAQYLQVKASTGQVIYNGGTASADAGYIRSNQKGATLRLLYGASGEFYVLGLTGTWTVDS